MLTLALLGLVLITACGSAPKVLGVSVGAGSTEDFAAYLQCMRAHGVPIVSEPATPGNLHTGAQASGSLDPNTPAFKAADNACRPLNPVANLSPTQRAQLKAANLAYAQCMRGHGIPDFPDPNADGALRFPIPPPSDLNTSSQAFQKADRACQSLKLGG